MPEDKKMTYPGASEEGLALARQIIPMLQTAAPSVPPPKPATRSYVVDTPFGRVSRNSTKDYKYVVIREDGWHQFSQSEAAAKKEHSFQKARGRNVLMVPIPPVDK